MFVYTLLYVATMVPTHDQFLCAPGSTAPPSSSVTSWLKSIELDAARARAGVRASTSKLARCTHAIECVQRAQAYSMLVVDLYRTCTGLSLLSSTSMQVTLFAFELGVRVVQVSGADHFAQGLLLCEEKVPACTLQEWVGMLGLSHVSHMHVHAVRTIQPAQLRPARHGHAHTTLPPRVVRSCPSDACVSSSRRCGSHVSG